MKHGELLRAVEDGTFARTRQALIDEDLHGPFPWMLRSIEDIRRDLAAQVLVAAGFSVEEAGELICDHEDDWR